MAVMVSRVVMPIPTRPGMDSAGMEMESHARTCNIIQSPGDCQETHHEDGGWNVGLDDVVSNLSGQMKL